MQRISSEEIRFDIGEAEGLALSRSGVNYRLEKEEMISWFFISSFFVIKVTILNPNPHKFLHDPISGFCHKLRSIDNELIHPAIAAFLFLYLFFKIAS